ncbi:Zinc-finger homeodomain protein [Melia azedarach]|uniref:Zinc-finger homeodomain protein n=2 Tax=Melia azedarach TaxID=155640 RepID=A0ACC1WRW9_MELAZ|nr:Zinc-finger homeodomain protein [Melia azedarach]KAJ4701951.1 Zinc-finger homeodomain protein [Melia azedarach]
MMMEIKQENETKTPGSERRRDGNNNGTSVHSFPQTLDHHLQRQPSLGQGRSPNPDRATVTSATIAPISTGSNSKPATNVRYRECLKNHAANIGGNVFDGCGEFMPSGEEGTIEALKCAACDCHRNFHRKELDGESQFTANSGRRTVMLNPLQLPPPLPSPTMIHHQKYTINMHTSPSSAIVAPMNVAFGGISGGTESSSEDLNAFHSNADGIHPPPPPPYVLSKKRFRTKFTQEQKDKMMEFAEKVGWRLQKQDEGEVEKFCAEVGVKRQVFKVWMHNNKNNVKKQQPADPV